MANPIYETTASNSGNLTTEHHSPGDLTGSIDRSRAGMAATYIEIPAVGPTTSVKEFPSQSAGLVSGGDHDTRDPMNR
jgi:hypothetical protein